MSNRTLSMICALCVCALLAPVLGACNGEDGGSGPFGRPGGGGTLAGKWTVVTKLVAASDATNPDYKPGDLREERWTVALNDAGATLTTPAGTIPGVIHGNTFAFEGGGDTGLNLKIKVRVEGAFDGPRRIVGTIKAQYFGTFNNYVGLDAWQFEGRR